MRMLLSTGLLLGFLANSASAQFFYLIPSDEPKETKLVFAGGPRPSERVDAQAFDSIQLTIHTTGNEPETVDTLAGGKGALRAGTGNAEVVSTVVPLRVVDRGESRPYLLKYVAKRANSVTTTGSQEPVGLELEITPKFADGQVRLLLTHNGQPLTNHELLVHLPGEELPKSVRSDESGHSPAFGQAGTYAVRAYLPLEESGEFQGRTYRAVRTYTTLTFPLPEKP